MLGIFIFGLLLWIGSMLGAVDFIGCILFVDAVIGIDSGRCGSFIGVNAGCGLYHAIIGAGVSVVSDIFCRFQDLISSSS